MEQSLILETTFLIDLERERLEGRNGSARAFLELHAPYRLLITGVVAGELAAGVSLGRHEVWEDFIRPFRILPLTREVSWEYGAAYRYLQQQGRLIGANDLWIAAAGLAYHVPVVTRNAEHFRRVPRLAVITY